MAKATKKPPTRRERRDHLEARRSRFVLIGAIVLCAVVLAAWFPASALYHQRANLAQANAQLSQLHSQDAALRQESENLNNTAEVGRIARQQYQLVSPGQVAYEVLPPAVAAPAGAPYAGDPGNAAPVAPSASSELPAGSVTTTTAVAPAPSAHGTATTDAKQHQSTTTLERMVQALEFWR